MSQSGLAGKSGQVYCLYFSRLTLISMEEDTSLVWRKSKISMQEGTSLVWRKTLLVCRKTGKTGKDSNPTSYTTRFQHHILLRISLS